MERRSLESAVANYSHMRGLFAIPAGILMILAGITNMEWLGTWAFWGAALAAGVAWLWITRYYIGKYGRITPSTRTQVKAGVVTVINVAMINGGVRLDWALDLPVNGTSAAFALIMLFSYAIGRVLRTHHVIIFGVLLVAGLLPVWGGVGGDLKINVGLMLMGVTTIVTGIFDNGALKRAFEPVENLELGNGDARA